MSIASRLEDAVILWNNGRHEGALLNALIAVAATSRLRFPNRKQASDSQAFTQFLDSVRQPIGQVEFRGKLETISMIFYKWLRCELVHEGAIPIDIAFVPDEAPGGMSIRAGGAPEYVLKLSHSWIFYLLNAVASAPENQQEFAGRFVTAACDPPYHQHPPYLLPQ
jgi:hypothetical protein